MPYDSPYYSSSTLGRRSPASSSRWSPSPGSNYGYTSTSYSSSESSRVYSPSSMSMYLPPRSPVPSSPSMAHRTMRQPVSQYAAESALSSAMSKRDTLIRSLVRSSHDLENHHFLSNESVSMITGSNYYNTSTRRLNPPLSSTSRYSRSHTTDLSNSSALASSGSYRTSSPLYTVPDSSYRNPYRPIVIERPSLSNYVPRPKEERIKALPRAIRRDRPLIKFRERDDFSPMKVRHLLDAWSKGEPLEEEAAGEDDTSNKNRDSVRSNDSGIGSYRSSYLRRSRQKSGDVTNDSNQTCAENHRSDTDDIEGNTELVLKTHTPSVDEGVHLDTDEGIHTPTPLTSPLGYRENSADIYDENKIQNNEQSGKLNSDFLQNQDATETSRSKRRVRINSEKYIEYPNDKRKLSENDTSDCLQNINDNRRNSNARRERLASLGINAIPTCIKIQTNLIIKDDLDSKKTENICSVDDNVKNESQSSLEKSSKNDVSEEIHGTMCQLKNKQTDTTVIKCDTEIKTEQTNSAIIKCDINVKNEEKAGDIVKPSLLIQTNASDKTDDKTTTVDNSCPNKITEIATKPEDYKQSAIQKQSDSKSEKIKENSALTSTENLPIGSEVKKKKKVKTVDGEAKKLKTKKVKVQSSDTMLPKVSPPKELDAEKIPSETKRDDHDDSKKKTESTIISPVVDQTGSTPKSESTTAENKYEEKTKAIIPISDSGHMTENYESNKDGLDHKVKVTKINDALLTENKNISTAKGLSDKISHKKLYPREEIGTSELKLTEKVVPLPEKVHPIKDQNELKDEVIKQTKIPNKGPKITKSDSTPDKDTSSEISKEVKVSEPENQLKNVSEKIKNQKIFETTEKRGIKQESPNIEPHVTKFSDKSQELNKMNLNSPFSKKTVPQVPSQEKKITQNKTHCDTKTEILNNVDVKALSTNKENQIIKNKITKESVATSIISNTEPQKLTTTQKEMKSLEDLKHKTKTKQLTKTEDLSIGSKNILITKENQNKEKVNEESLVTLNETSITKKQKNIESELKREPLLIENVLNIKTISTNKNIPSNSKSEIKSTAIEKNQEEQPVMSKDTTLISKGKEMKPVSAELETSKQNELITESKHLSLDLQVTKAEKMEVDVLQSKNKENYSEISKIATKRKIITADSDRRVTKSRQQIQEGYGKKTLLPNESMQSENVSSKTEKQLVLKDDNVIVSEKKNKQKIKTEENQKEDQKLRKESLLTDHIQTVSDITEQKSLGDEKGITEAISTPNKEKEVANNTALPESGIENSLSAQKTSGDRETLTKLQKSASASGPQKNTDNLTGHKLRRSSTTEITKIPEDQKIILTEKNSHFPTASNKIKGDSKNQTEIIDTTLSKSNSDTKNQCMKHEIKRSTTENLASACEKLHVLQKSSSTDGNNLKQKVLVSKNLLVLKQHELPKVDIKTTTASNTTDIKSKIEDELTAKVNKIQRSNTGELVQSKSTEKLNLLKKSSSADMKEIEKIEIQPPQRLQKPPLPKKAKATDVQSSNKTVQNISCQNSDITLALLSKPESNEVKLSNKTDVVKDSTTSEIPLINHNPETSSNKKALKCILESTVSIKETKEIVKQTSQEAEKVKENSFVLSEISEPIESILPVKENSIDKIDIPGVDGKITEQKNDPDIISKSPCIPTNEIQAISPSDSVPAKLSLETEKLKDVKLQTKTAENLKVPVTPEVLKDSSTDGQLITEQAPNTETKPKKAKVKKEKKTKLDDGEKPKKKKKKKTPVPDSGEIKEIVPSHKVVKEEVCEDIAQNSITELKEIPSPHSNECLDQIQNAKDKAVIPEESISQCQDNDSTKIPETNNLDNLWGDYTNPKDSSTLSTSIIDSPNIRYADVPFSKRCTIEDFNLLKVLGRGSYGKVMLAELKGGNQCFAVKCLKKNVVLEDNDVECTMIEREVLAMGSNHPYLCTLYFTFQSESHLFFVMEYLSGGDLMFHIQQCGRFDQDRARFYAAEIVCALKYLHKNGIIYRDAKLDNICIDSEGHVRLVDFGFCKLRIYRKECLPRNLCGTPDYMAPEIIKGYHYNQSVDWWSFGVLLYEMLIGHSPFNGNDEEELFWSVCNEEANFPRFLSKEATEIMVLLLDKNAETRLGMPGCSAGDIFCQPFFRPIDWKKVERKELDPPFKPKLKSVTDVSNFDSDFTTEKAALTPTDAETLIALDQSQFIGFTYTNPMISELNS